jgi:hypothetical protein
MSGLVTGRQGRVDTIPPVEGERDMQAGKTARDGAIHQARSRIPMNRLTGSMHDRDQYSAIVNVLNKTEAR